MTLRIERALRGKLTTLRLIGQIRTCDLAELTEQVDKNEPPMQFDLDELTLVDVGVVRFLSQCENNGVGLENCPLYIREWIKREREKK